MGSERTCPHCASDDPGRGPRCDFCGEELGNAEVLERMGGRAANDLARIRDLEARLVKAEAQRDGWKLMCEGKDGLLAGYRIGRSPSQATWKKLERAKEMLEKADGE